MSRRRFLRITLAGVGGVPAATLFLSTQSKDLFPPPPTDLDDLGRFEWGFLVDTTRCIGCGSCVRACQKENGVPDGYYRTWVERYEVDKDGEVHVDSPDGAIASFQTDLLPRETRNKAFFVPKLCNHCRSSACTQVCPVGATFDTPDGVVLIDKDRCVGCGYCVQACPYGCRYIDERTGTADKCTLCYHRLHRGMTTACAEACPREARICGDLRAPKSRLRQVLRERRYGLLKPDLGTRPKCYYVGLDPEVV
ncbi:MAG: 4Fe-4S dicluster domain-containing protein [Planctomycetes bacterium]|nr:4Fe-4S dicluster domain-containing protein [Planctomycetota bacterium]